MNAVDPKERESHRAAGATAWHDSTEARAVVVTFVALALFVYLVGFIVLPFVVAGIIAYICTPLLDWLAGRTGLPRPQLAVLLFLLLVGLAGIDRCHCGTASCRRDRRHRDRFAGNA